tara:strand:- start:56309 stop:56779 length:471 start_codon:yes stop_codon:yes gene_type:complete
MTFSCEEQIGGFANVELFLVTGETSGWPKQLNDTTAGEVVFTPLDNSVDGVLIEESIDVSERPGTGDAGELFNVRISFDFASQSEAMEQLLDQYKANDLVAKVCKHYPQQKIYGSNRYPLTLSYETVNGTRPEQGSLTRVSLRGSVPHRAPYYNPE